MEEKNIAAPLKGKICLIGIVVIFIAVTFGCAYQSVAVRCYDGPQRSMDDVCFVFPARLMGTPGFTDSEGIAIVKIDGIDRSRRLDINGAELLPGNHVLEVSFSMTKELISYRRRTVIWSETPVPIILNCEPAHIYMLDFKVEENRWNPFIVDISLDSKFRSSINRVKY